MKEKRKALFIKIVERAILCVWLASPIVRPLLTPSGRRIAKIIPIVLTQRIDMAIADKTHASRPLTDCEVSIAHETFRAQMDYRVVRVHPIIISPPGKAGFQDGNDIYVPKPYYKPDFECKTSTDFPLPHELVHVFQYQRMGNAAQNLADFKTQNDNQFDDSKTYAREPDKSYKDLNLEQQADRGAETFAQTRTINAYKAQTPSIVGDMYIAKVAADRCKILNEMDLTPNCDAEKSEFVAAYDAYDRTLLDSEDGKALRPAARLAVQKIMHCENIQLIDEKAECHVLLDRQLVTFMNVLGQSEAYPHDAIEKFATTAKLPSPYP